MGSHAVTVARYRQLRAISSRHHKGALAGVAPAVIRDVARQIGIRRGRTLFLGNEEEMVLVLDLAIHTSKPDRSRALDRYARSAAPPSGSDEALVLAAMQRAAFSIWRVVRRHDIAGVVVMDVATEEEVWLMDEGIGMSLPTGAAFASRIFRPAAFAMTCGVLVPIDADVVEELVDTSEAFRRGVKLRSFTDRGCAVAVYRTAIQLGVMDTVEYRDPALAA